MRSRRPDKCEALKAKLEAKQLECDLLGEVIAVLQKNLQELLAIQEMRLRAFEEKREPVIEKPHRFKVT